MRLIGSNGEQIGIVSIEEAVKAANEATLDLVEISPNADPPVCQILDSGKYQYELRKKQAAAKKKQKRIQVKEVKFRPATEEADYQVKVRNLIRFLEGGDKVKVTVRFRGRELMHREFGYKLLQRVQEDLSDYGVVETQSKMEGRQMIVVLAPKKSKKENNHSE